MRVDTVQRTDAHHADADDDLHLSEVDGYLELVIAMINRAHQDAVGNTGTSGNLSLEARYLWTVDGRAFFRDGRCRHWCECIGINDFRLLGL